MKSTNQIQIAVQEGEPLTEEEMRLCIEAQRNISHFYENQLLALIEAIREGKPLAVLKMKADFAWGTHERMFAASKKPPSEWLGADNIPGTPEYKKRLEWAKRLFEKATGETL